MARNGQILELARAMIDSQSAELSSAAARRRTSKPQRVWRQAQEQKFFDSFLSPHALPLTPHRYFSLNDLIRPLQHADWNCQINLFCSFEIDHKLNLSCLLHRQISRFGPFQNLVHVTSRASIEIIVVR